MSARSNWRSTRTHKIIGAAAQHARQHRRLYRIRPAAADAVRHDRHGGRRLRHSRRLCRDQGGAVEHQPDRALSRRRPPRGELSDRARARGRRATSSASTRSSCAGATPFPPTRCRSSRRSARITIAAIFAGNLETALDAADYAGFAARAAQSKARGKLRGIGIANVIEQAAGPVPEYAEIRFNPSGTALLLLGTKTHGQGHDTAFKQILHETARHRSGRCAVYRRRHRSPSRSAWAPTARARW